MRIRVGTGLFGSLVTFVLAAAPTHAERFSCGDAPRWHRRRLHHAAPDLTDADVFHGQIGQVSSCSRVAWRDSYRGVLILHRQGGRTTLDAVLIWPAPRRTSGSCLCTLNRESLWTLGSGEHAHFSRPFDASSQRKAIQSRDATLSQEWLAYQQHISARRWDGKVSHLKHAGIFTLYVCSYGMCMARRARPPTGRCSVVSSMKKRCHISAGST